MIGILVWAALLYGVAFLAVARLRPVARRRRAAARRLPASSRAGPVRAMGLALVRARRAPRLRRRRGRKLPRHGLLPSLPGAPRRREPRDGHASVLRRRSRLAPLPPGRRRDPVCARARGRVRSRRDRARAALLSGGVLFSRLLHRIPLPADDGRLAPRAPRKAIRRERRRGDFSPR